MPTTKSTVELLKKHGFAPVLKESPGGHTWLNWRSYLIEFAPQLFLGYFFIVAASNRCERSAHHKSLWTFIHVACRRSATSPTQRASHQSSVR